jgi:drug/metabolite transporter (DMT)-like permease
LGHLLLFFLSILSLSQSPNIIRWSEVPPLVLGSWRLLGAALIMLVLHTLWTRRQAQAWWKKSSQASLAWAVLTGIFFFLHLWSYAYAAHHTLIANAMVLFALNPLFTAAGSAFLLKDKFERQHGLAFFLAFIGVYFLVMENLDWDQGLDGKVAALVSGALYSLYILSGKKARLEIENSQLTLLVYTITALLFLGSALYVGLPMTDYPSHSWVAIGLLIVVPTFCGHWIFTYLLKHMNINFMSSGKLAEPALAAVTAFFVFGETLNSNTIIAFGFTLVAILVLIFGRKGNLPGS